MNGSFADKALTGVQRYAYEMCLALKESGYPFRIVAPCHITLPEYASLNSLVELVPKSALGKLGRWEQGDLFRFMSGRRRDVLWNPSNLAVFGPFRQITTVHDLAVYRNAGWFDWKFAALYKLYTPYAVKRSERVLTVSETVKREIVDRFRIPPDKVRVAYDGYRPGLPSAAPARAGEYLVILGSLDPRKNLANALAGWRAMDAAVRGTAKLLVVGSANWRLAFRGAPQPEDPSIEFLGRIGDDELAALLEGCLGSVYLSRYEGFGLPALEALARGKPCLLSDIPVFRELFGPGCGFADPEDVPAIARGLEQLLAQAREGMGPFAEGYLARFSWKASAQVLLESLA